MTSIEKEMIKAAHSDVTSAHIILSIAQENGRKLTAKRFDEVMRNVHNAMQWLNSLKKEIKE